MYSGKLEQTIFIQMALCLYVPSEVPHSPNYQESDSIL